VKSECCYFYDKYEKRFQCSRENVINIWQTQRELQNEEGQRGFNGKLYDVSQENRGTYSQVQWVNIKAAHTVRINVVGDIITDLKLTQIRNGSVEIPIKNGKNVEI